MNCLARLIAFLRAPWRPLAFNRVSQPVIRTAEHLTSDAIDAAVRGD